MPLDLVPVKEGSRPTAKVFPTSVWDRLLLNGYSAEVCFRPGATVPRLRSAAGLAQREPARTDGIGLVLGAGNITSIAVLDTLYELAANNRVVILKLNPVMDAMLDVTRGVLAPLVELGVVRVVTGGVDVGAHLVHHPGVGHVHITGSAASHDAIVFGSGEEGARRKAAGETLLPKPITSELGGVSPTIVVPYRWSKRDLRHQARHIATQRLHNGGYNCIAAQMVVIPETWPNKRRFLHELRSAIDAAPERAAYYPGSAARVEAAVAAHPDAEVRRHGRVLVSGLAPEPAAAVFRTEYFSPVLGVVEVPGNGEAYLAAASAFVNEQLEGTLGANVLVHPRYARSLGGLFAAFVEGLRYGTVAVNSWTAFGYLTATAPWGAYPGSTVTDVQSGVGVVHNALLLPETEQTVVTGPFRPFPRSTATGQSGLSPTPPWFVSNRTGARTSRLFVEFLGRPSVTKLPRIVASAMRG